MLINPEPLAPWRSPLARALHLNRSLPYSRYLQLATVGSTGEPACRTVVFRGFLPSTNHVQIITDRRSQKVTQMAHQARGEICWYFPKTREQFRLAGNLLVVDAETTEPKLQAARTQMWQSISDVARSQFAGPPPDHPCDPMLPISDDAPEAISPLSPLLPLPTFCLVLLMPDRVDHLQLKGNPQLRHRYTSDRSHDQSQSWTMHSINP